MKKFETEVNLIWFDYITESELYVELIDNRGITYKGTLETKEATK